MRDMLKMVLVLSLICGLSGFTLASVREATKSTIDEQVLTYVQGPALTQALESYDNNPIKDRKTFTLEHEEITVFPALKKGKLIGIAFERFRNGYGGPVGVMIGLSPDGKHIEGIGITTSKETPGLGARASEAEYRDQFKGLQIDNINLTKNGGTIEAISGASLTSNATVAAVNDAVKIFEQLKNDFAQTWGPIGE